jgi:polysaccharide biosynthesis/export protein
VKRFFPHVLTLLLLLASVAAGAQSNSTARNNLRAGAPDIGHATSPTSTPQVPDEFVIGTGDVLAINVWKEPEISRVVPVRSDGRISLPLVGEVQASGKTARQLEDELHAKVKEFVSEPEVTVIVQEIKSQRFNILGMVSKPGSYTLTKPMRVIDAIALAGGFRDFAKQKDIYVLRRNADGSETRLAFNYKDVIKGRSSQQNVPLESNDTIVVP